MAGRKPKDKSKKGADLSTKALQDRFVSEFLKIREKPGRAIIAATNAGYADPSKAAKTLMKNQDILDLIEARKKELEDKYHVSAESLIRELAKIAFLDPADYYRFDRENGIQTKDSHDKDGDPQMDMSPIKSIKEIKVGKGRGACSRIEIKFYDKQEAIKALREILGTDAPAKNVNINENRSDNRSVDELKQSILKRLSGTRP